MKAMPGGKAKHDTMDAQTIAVRRRGGRLPQASVSPAKRRATRDWLRRRRPLARTRGARLAHGHKTTSHYHLPALGQKLASTAKRHGVAERGVEPAGQNRMDLALALMGSSEAWLRDLARAIVKAARHQDANTRYRLRTGPGIGKMLSRVLRDELHASARFPQGPALASSGRLVQGAKASAGKRSGPSGTNIGTAPLKWACAAAAAFFGRETPAGQNVLTRLETTHSPGQALTILAPTVARAVDDLFKRKPAVDRPKLLHASGRGVGALTTSRDSRGLSLRRNARPGVTQGGWQRPGA